WILSLDADEEVSPELAEEIAHQLASTRLVEPRATVIDVVREIGTQVLRPARPTEMVTESAGRVEIAFQAFGPGEAGFYVSRKNLFLSRWIKFGGFWPD